MNLDLEFLNSDPIFEVEEHHFSSVYSKPTHLLHQFWTLSSTSIPWIDPARWEIIRWESLTKGRGWEKLSFGVKRDEFQNGIEQRIKEKATKWMRLRMNSQKSEFLNSEIYGNVRFPERSKSIQSKLTSAPFRGILHFKIFFYGFAWVFRSVS